MPAKCSASKTSSVAETCGQLARPAVQRAPDGEAVGHTYPQVLREEVAPKICALEGHIPRRHGDYPLRHDNAVAEAV